MKSKLLNSTIYQILCHSKAKLKRMRKVVIIQYYKLTDHSFKEVPHTLIFKIKYLLKQCRRKQWRRKKITKRKLSAFIVQSSSNSSSKGHARSLSQSHMFLSSLKPSKRERMKVGWGGMLTLSSSSIRRQAANSTLTCSLTPWRIIMIVWCCQSSCIIIKTILLAPEMI